MTLHFFSLLVSFCLYQCLELLMAGPPIESNAGNYKLFSAASYVERTWNSDVKASGKANTQTSWLFYQSGCYGYNQTPRPKATGRGIYLTSVFMSHSVTEVSQYGNSRQNPGGRKWNVKEHWLLTCFPRLVWPAHTSQAQLPRCAIALSGPGSSTLIINQENPSPADLPSWNLLEAYSPWGPLPRWFSSLYQADKLLIRIALFQFTGPIFPGPHPGTIPE